MTDKQLLRQKIDAYYHLIVSLADQFVKQHSPLTFDKDDLIQEAMIVICSTYKKELDHYKAYLVTSVWRHWARKTNKERRKVEVQAHLGQEGVYAFTGSYEDDIQYVLDNYKFSKTTTRFLKTLLEWPVELENFVREQKYRGLTRSTVSYLGWKSRISKVVKKELYDVLAA